MDYNKLRTFILAAETGDLQEVAKRIFRTQPAVSQQIQKLQQELGLKLFEKKGKKLILTCQGEELLQHIRQPMSDLACGIEEALNRESIAHGTIRIGIVADHAVSCELFTPLAAYCASNPKVDLRITLGISRIIEPMLLENRLDFAVLVYLTKPKLFSRQPIARAAHIPVCSPRYLSENRIATYNDLVKADLIDQDEELWAWTDWFTAHFPKGVAHLRQTKPRIAVHSYLAMKAVVMGGFGIAVLPEWLIQDELKEGSLVRLFPRKKALHFDLAIVHRVSKKLRHCEKILLSHLAGKRGRF